MDDMGVFEQKGVKSLNRGWELLFGGLFQTSFAMLYNSVVMTHVETVVLLEKK